jgi:RNA polymerase I-specific transcription initiation factor RRN6
MADYTLLDVGYGFFGAPSYDENEQSWTFGRNLGRHHVLNFLGSFEILSTASPGASLTADYLPHHNGTDQIARKTHARQVFDSFPDLRGSFHLVQPSLLASQIVSRAQQSYDPSQGDRLAVGMLNSLGQNHCPLYALPGGFSGESLRLVKTALVAHSFGKRVGHILVPRPTQDVSWWVGRGAPIRQICFDSTCGGERASRFLAIRTPLTTWIFRVLSRPTLVPPAGHATDTRYPFSPIEIEPLLDIPVPTQCEHADVTFNPWCDRQIAVIDQVGRWSVLNLKSGRTVERHKSLLPTSSGVMTRSDDGKRNQHRLHNSKYPEDGWARIRWTGDVNTLVLCTRKVLEFVDLKGRSMSAPDLTLGLAARDEKTWHLDARVCDGQRDQLFILTTIKIFWLRVFSADRALPANEKSGGRVLLSVRHFRDPRDLTMQIKVLEHDNGMVNNSERDWQVLMYSRDSRSTPQP